MSKPDLLTVEETTIAAAQGWSLARVFDGPTNYLTIIPLAFQHPMPSVPDARRYVANLATRGSQVAMKAMTLIAHDLMKKEAA